MRPSLLQLFADMLPDIAGRPQQAWRAPAVLRHYRHDRRWRCGRLINRRAGPFRSAAPGSAPSRGSRISRSPGGIWTRTAPIYFDDLLASEEARRET